MGKAGALPLAPEKVLDLLIYGFAEASPSLGNRTKRHLVDLLFLRAGSSA